MRHVIMLFDLTVFHSKTNMSYGTVVMKFLILYLSSFVFLETNGDVAYIPKITDRVFSCDNFKNEFLDCDGLRLGSGDNPDDAAKLGGEVKFLKDVISDYDLEIDVWKIMELGDEYMYNTRINFCSSLENTDAPWAPVIQELNITGCPVVASIFQVQDLTVSLDAMKDVLSHEFTGEYLIQMSFMNVADKISCHNIELCILEEQEEE